MKDKELKPIANAVGVGALDDPHFEEHTQKRNPSKAYLNPKTKPQTLTSNVAITLIALVITIIVMLILVGVTVSIAINGGLFSTAKRAVAETQYQEDREMLFSAVIGAINNNAEVDFDNLNNNLPEGFTGNNGTYTSKAGNLFCVDKSGNITTPQVTIDGETIVLTPDNVGEYLGKVVTNYKKDYNTTETITIGTETYTVSTKYRLYYVDFENKYKDGAGTIYLKADCTKINYSLHTTETTSENLTITDAIKIKNLNPALYNDEEGNPITPPTSTNPNMQAVMWLTNTKNWEGLKDDLNGINKSDINYVVGAPSLEMMVDSYNIHYNLTQKTLDTSTLDKNSERVKLFYKYPYDDNNFGYGVGPSNRDGNKDGYGFYASDYTVQPSKNSEEDVGTMYYPIEGLCYWLASPSANHSFHVMLTAGHLTYTGVGESYSGVFCPLVSLKPTVQLELKK